MKATSDRFRWAILDDSTSAQGRLRLLGRPDLNIHFRRKRSFNRDSLYGIQRDVTSEDEPKSLMNVG